MGTLTTAPYDVAEGQEWCDYFERFLVECQRLIGEKRVPDTESLDAFMHDSQLVMQQVRRDVAAARGRGETTTRTAVDLTHEEYTRLMSMNESVLNLLLILEMRGAVSLQRSEAVGRVADAIDAGQFVR